MQEWRGGEDEAEHSITLEIKSILNKFVKKRLKYNEMKTKEADKSLLRK